MLTITRYSSNYTQQAIHIVILLFSLEMERIGFFFQERVLPDNGLWYENLPKLEKFWRTCILPEILGRWYTRKLDLIPLLLPDSTQPFECYCRQIKPLNERVVCANSECRIKNFHKSCLSIENIPTEWFCPHCRKLTKYKKKKNSQQPTLKTMQRP